MHKIALGLKNQLQIRKNEIYTQAVSEDLKFFKDLNACIQLSSTAFQLRAQIQPRSNCILRLSTTASVILHTLVTFAKCFHKMLTWTPSLRIKKRDWKTLGSRYRKYFHSLNQFYRCSSYPGQSLNPNFLTPPAFSQLIVNRDYLF